MSAPDSKSADPQPAAPGGAPSVAPPDAAAVGRSAPVVISTYFAEGLPYSMVHQVLTQQYMTAIALEPGLLGLTSLLHLPWNIKFLWAPLVDRYGTAKRWLVGAQLLIGLLLVVAAASVGASALWPLVITLGLMSFVAATNDIAIDAYYLRALPKGEQSAMTGVRIAAYRAALLFGNGALVALAGVWGFGPVTLVAAFVVFGLSLLHALLLRAPEERVDVSKQPWSEVVRSFIRIPHLVVALAFVLTFRAGDAIMFAMNAKFLLSLGLDTAARGLYNGIFGTAASIVGSIVGGAWVAKRGLFRSLIPIAIIQGLAILLYAALEVVRPSLPWIVFTVIVEQFVAGMGLSAFLVVIMRLCDGPYKATHFAFATAIMSISVTAAGSVSGYLLEAVGFRNFFLIAAAASLPGILLTPWVRRLSSPR